MNSSTSPNMLRPALICGPALGVLAALPGLDLLNCCTCCSFAIGAGFLASYLYSRECASLGAAFEPGRGAGVGALTGLFWGVASAVVSTIITVTFGNKMLEWLIPFLEDNPSTPPELIDQLEIALEEGVSFGSVMIEGVMALLLGTIFATLGGLIGGAVFKVEARVPAPPAAPGPPAPPGPPTPPGPPASM